jgi:flagellar hook-associated protein 1 FlgK
MVRATFAGFQTALTALQSNSKKLDVTSHNLANMNVEGYTRQQLQTSSLNYENPTSFYMNENDVNVGFGVSMDSVSQLRDKFLDVQYREQNTSTSYNDATEYSLNSIAGYFDESNVDGIRASFDDIQKALTTMQDTSKVQDPVYEGQLQSTMEATCTLLNSAAQKIKTAEDNEFEKLAGAGTSENGAVETINNLLRDIGELNKQIKHNQLIGNPALELQDERNLKIDKLSSYIPITVESFSDSYEVKEAYQEVKKDADGNIVTDDDGNTVYETKTKTVTRYRIYNYDANGKIVGRSDWPEDLRISLNYTTGTTNSETGATSSSKSSIILVNGTYQDSEGKNYGSVALNTTDGNYTKWASTNPSTTGPLDTQLDFTSTATNSTGTIVDATTVTTANSENSIYNGYVRFSGGSVQASLDMLAKSDPSGTATSGLKQGTYYGYDYYMDQLDNLAQNFAQEMNVYNHMGNNWDYPDVSEETAKSNAETALQTVTSSNNYLMLVNRDTQTAQSTVTKDSTTGKYTSITSEVTAENIALSANWVNGTTTIGLKGSDSNLTVLNMLKSFTQPHELLADKTFANYMNTLTTKLVNDQATNKDALDTNKAVLDSISSSKDQISGISLDEEAANMMTYVSSYNAAAKVMNAFDETLQALLAIV